MNSNGKQIISAMNSQHSALNKSLFKHSLLPGGSHVVPFGFVEVFGLGTTTITYCPIRNYIRVFRYESSVVGGAGSLQQALSPRSPT